MCTVLDIILQITDLLFIKNRSRNLSRSKYITNYWMATTREHIEYHWKKVGDGMCTFINSIPRTRKPEKDYMEPDSNQKM